MEPFVIDQTPQLALWRSEFGRSYTDRNDLERPARIAAWQRILPQGVERALEVGCNAGWNLTYLSRLGVADLTGIEPQSYAVRRARERSTDHAIVHGTAFDLPFRDRWFDLAFTSGVLIHIGPEQLGTALDEIYRVSRRWIVAIEYDHPTELEIEYRGHGGALWKRDHGKAWRDRHPDLIERASGFLGADDGYDDCTFHVFEKP
jgi:pseudaminic acid biosynthesis-associated methylase